MINILFKKIKKEMDIEFQRLFIEELCALLKLPIDLFKKEELINEIGIYKETDEWYVAFTSACRKLNKIELLNKRRNLTLEEEKIFDTRLFDMLINNKNKILDNEMWNLIKNKIEKENDYYKISIKENQKWLKAIYKL